MCQEGVVVQASAGRRVDRDLPQVRDHHDPGAGLADVQLGSRRSAGRREVEGVHLLPRSLHRDGGFGTERGGAAAAPGRSGD